MLNLKGYGDGAIARFRSVGVDSLGGGGAELGDRALLRTASVFPLARLKLDRSLARDSVPIAGYGILAKRGASP